MDIPLLTTKLYIPPIRPELVSRPRLVDRLNAGIYRKLTLISAPAGFGKTTLVNEWLCGTDRLVTWFSLDESDNDLIRFLSYLVAAFRQIDDQIGQAVQHLLEPPQPPPVEVFLTELINSVVAHSSPFVLVLDDYHVITELKVHQVVSFLLERQPPPMHLVIVSRQDPPISLSRLRGRGQVTEVRQSDLRFTAEETVTFLNRAMRLNLSSSEMTALETQTEGWIAGLQMAAVALQSRIAAMGMESAHQFIENFSDRHHFILDYLTDEVLAGLSESVRGFLLRTSILDRMCSSLCDALVAEEMGSITPVTPSRDILEALQHQNLFVVPLDGEGQWYRYHRLFAQLLRARLQDVAPERVAGFYRRAALWHEEKAFLPEAVHYALEIPDYDLAAGIIERAIPQVHSWSSVNVAIFQEWLKALPDDVVRSRPKLRLFASRVFYIIGQREKTENILQDLEATVRGSSLMSDAEEILGMVLVDRASYAAVRGDVQQAVALANQAMTYVPNHTTMRMRVQVVLGLAYFRGGNVRDAGRAFSQAISAVEAVNLGFIAAPIYCNMAEVYIVQGQLRNAIRLCQEALELATVDGKPTSVAGFPGLELGKVLYEQNDLPQAEKYVSESLDLLGKSGTTDSFGIGHALLARIKQAQGDTESARTAIQRAVEISSNFAIERVSTFIGAYQARIWLASGEFEMAADWAALYRQLDETQYIREFEDLVLARVLLAQNKLSEVLALVGTLRQSAEAAGRKGTLIEISALHALTLLKLGHVDEAVGVLKSILQPAESEGYARVFIDEGAPMAELLRMTLKSGASPGYVRQLLFAIESEMRVEPLTDMSALIEPLSPRELEVLGCLSAGLTNLEIAQRLFISLPTVKSHARNIYGKLGVHNRLAAINRARALGILAS